MALLGLSYMLSAQSHRILYLHRVGSQQKEFYPQGIEEEHLEQILAELHSRGFRFISLSEAIKRRQESKPLHKTISLTTDDGFACNHQVLLPILKRRSIPLTLFLVGKCLDNQALAWNHKLLQIRQASTEPELDKCLNELEPKWNLKREGTLAQQLFSAGNKQGDALANLLWDQFMPQSQQDYLDLHKPFLSRSQMLDLQNSGAEFALHSFSHADFSRLSLAEMGEELQQNREAYEDLGLPYQELFAFPYGRSCRADLIPTLCKSNKLSLCLGGRYTVRDNRQPAYLWQRQALELSAKELRKELWVLPWLRVAKDIVRHRT